MTFKCVVLLVVRILTCPTGSIVKIQHNSYKLKCVVLLVCILTRPTKKMKYSDTLRVIQVLS